MRGGRGNAVSLTLMQVGRIKGGNYLKLGVQMADSLREFLLLYERVNYLGALPIRYSALLPII